MTPVLLVAVVRPVCIRSSALSIPKRYMALAIEVLDLATAVVISNQIGGILIPKNRQSLIELVLLDITVGGEVATGAASGDEVLAGKKCERTREIVVREVNLGKPERIRVTV